MVNRTTYAESRLLPAMIASCLLLTAGLISVSGEPFWIRVMLAGILILAAVLPLYRSLRPRWVLRIKGDRLECNDFYARKIVEVDLAMVVDAHIEKTAVSGVTAEGGIGFQKKLILHAENQTFEVPLPFLEGTAERALAAVRNALSSANRKRP